MIDSKCYECVLKQLIEIRAYEIWEYRQKNNLQYRFDEEKNDLVKITDIDDYIEAKEQILNRFAQEVVNKTSKELNNETQKQS